MKPADENLAETQKLALGTDGCATGNALDYLG